MDVAFSQDCLKNLLCNGQSLILPKDAEDELLRCADALEILGRPDVSVALRKRISSELCELYPSLILVVCQLAGSPLHKNLPSNLQPVSEEESIEDNFIGEHWQEPTYSSSEEESHETIIDKTLGRRRDSFDDPPLRSERKIGDPVFPEAPVYKEHFTSHEFIAQAKLALQGLSHQIPRNFRINDLSLGACTSIGLELIEMKRVIDNLRSVTGILSGPLGFQLAQWDTEISKVDAKTVVGALNEFNKILEPGFSLMEISNDYRKSRDIICRAAKIWPQLDSLCQSLAEIEHRAVKLWVAGQSNDLICFETEPSSVKSAWTNKVICKIRTSHKYVELCGRCVWTARHYGIILRSRDPEDVCTEFMGAIRPRLVKAWDILSRVYLAQDPRMLSVIHDAHSNTIEDVTMKWDAACLSWLQRPFYMVDGMPHVPLDSLTSLVFTLSTLQDEWIRVVNAMSQSDSIAASLLQAELEMKSKKIAGEIAELHSLKKLI